MIKTGTTRPTLLSSLFDLRSRAIDPILRLQQVAFSRSFDPLYARG